MTFIAVGIAKNLLRALKLRAVAIMPDIGTEIVSVLSVQFPIIYIIQK